MAKRSRKTAFGQADVVRRSSLKTFAVCARDPLSLDNAALRKNVRTTLLVGTALGASFMAVAMFGEPANAAILCQPGAIAVTPANYAGDQNTGIYCTTANDLTVNASGGTLGGNGALGGDGSGLQIVATDNGSDGGLIINVNNSDAIGTKAAPFAPVTGNGIEVTLTDTSAGISLTDTVTITNSGPIGLAGVPYGPAKHGIYVNSKTDTSLTNATAATGGNATNTTTITNSAAIFSTFDGIDARNNASANGTSSGATGTGTGGSAAAGVVIINNAGGVITSTEDGIDARSYAYANGSASGSSGVATGGKATATTTISNLANITTGPGGSEGIDGEATANADGGASGSPAFTARGGTAIATTTISNTGVLVSSRDGIRGEAHAFASGYADSKVTGSTGTGGHAEAHVLINNTGGSITTTGIDGISTFSFARANGFGFYAFGGTAIATTDITNTVAIVSVDDGLRGSALAYANGIGSNTAPGSGTGGNAIATTTLTNQGGSITTSDVGSSGIYGRSYASAYGKGYFAQGGTATATTTLTNTAAGTINSTGDGIEGFATSNATATAVNGPGNSKSKATGGTATAGVTITNGGAITTTGPGADGLEGVARANSSANGYTAIGGTGIATTSISNGGSIFAADNGIVGIAISQADGKGYSNKVVPVAPNTGGVGKGGTAIATVNITNSGAIVDKGIAPAPNQEDADVVPTGSGIDGFTFASASGFGFTATGGTAVSGTTIANSNSITSYYSSGIFGFSGATAVAIAPVGTKGSTATGGTAQATTTITNSGTIATGGFPPFLFGTGISGVSFAAATAVGYTAKGGTATANTTISNSGAITAYGLSLFGDGIDGVAIADASAVGNFGLGAPFATGGKATAGTATANVLISNTTGAPISAYFGNGILGVSFANASALAFHAYGGTATANTVITNTGAIKSDAGIAGFSAALAVGIGSPFADPGIGKGGTATATTLISNTGNINATYGFGFGAYGIIGGSFAVAGAFGRQATGGTATATTTISNTGAATRILSADGGISGTAVALSDAIGLTGINGKAIGGTATAGVTITNVANIYSGGAGIAGVSVASANGVLFPFGGKTATGGTARATTTITNSGTITTYGSNAPGIVGYSYAFANGSRTGGTAIATTNISNTGAVIITSGSNSAGIAAGSYVSANGGYKGGTATATTTVNNAASIFTAGSNSPGIAAYSYAQANAFLGGGTAGTASATTLVSNGGFIYTSGSASAGIIAGSQAYANSYGFAGKAGTATASSTVTNTQKILTTGSFSPGIFAYSTAGAAGLGGTATATTTVNNSAVINTSGSLSAGIFAGSLAYAGSLLTGTATAVSAVTNSGSIITGGFLSPGIVAASAAFAGGASSANATSYVTNSGGVLTTGTLSPGVSAFAIAAGAYGPFSSAGKAVASATVKNSGAVKTTESLSPGLNAAAIAIGDIATATASVSNSGAITTYGFFSAGINAYSLANANYGPHGVANANTTVVNLGNIVTTGSNSAGINASATALGDASAITSVSNLAASITTYGSNSPGINANSYAFAAVGTATAQTTVTNSGTIVTYGSNSPGIVAYAGAVAVQGPNFADVKVVVSNSGTVITTGSFSPAVSATIFGDASIAISNSGSLIALGWPFTAIQAYAYGIGAASTTISNSGYVYGNVQTAGGRQSGSVDTFNNSGTWVMRGNSNFGSGVLDTNDTLNNSGTIAMVNSRFDRTFAGAGYHYGTGFVIPLFFDRFHTVFLNGLDNFNNSGTVTMQNGSPDQQIVVSGNFNGSGNSTLKVDAFLAGPSPFATSDILTVGGNVSGSTRVVVNDVNPGLGAYNPIGIPVVIVGGSGVIDPNAFSLAGGPIIKGLFDYDIYLRPDHVFVLASTPNQAANELPRLVTAVQDVWHQAAGVWADRSADLRATLVAPTCDPRLITKAPCVAPVGAGIGPGVWARAFGDWSHNGGTADEAPPPGLLGKTHSYDVSYHQNIYGVQAGIDFAAQRMGYENFVVGLMGGAVESKVDFASGTGVKFSGGNIGAYATLINGGLFADALVLANFLNMNYNHTVWLASNSANVFSFGGHFDMGYRFNFQGGWFAEPLATIDGVWTDFHKFDLPGVSVDLNTNNNQSLRGRLAGRIGTSFVNGGYRIEPSVTLGVWHAFAGDNSADLTSGWFTLNLTDANSHLTYGEVSGAVNVFELASRWSAFLKGDFRFGDDYYGGGVKGGARFQW